MIDVGEVLRAVPTFETFCSVKKLHALVETIRADSKHCHVEVAGSSVNGLPIHHVRFGKGSVKALIVAFPHPNEPVGGLTVFSLMSLLSRAHPALVNADVEWHIVPCIDPDGAMLNEGWSQKPFTLESYLRGFHRQEPRDQVEMSFPITYKRLVFDQPIKEAMILRDLITAIRPDFYFSLHNAALGGGAYYLVSRDVGRRYYRALKELLAQHHIALQASTAGGGWASEIEQGISALHTTRMHYDLLEKTMPCPEQAIRHGECSWDYLADIKENALTFVAELPYVRHPLDGSNRETGQDLRQLRLRVDADNKYVATVILEEWDKVQADLDSLSPFYRKIFNGVIAVKEQLHDGLPSWPHKTRDVLLNSVYRGTMKKGERFNVYLERFFLLCQSHEFVRLLQASTQTSAVRRAAARVDAVIGEGLVDIAKHINADQFEVIDCNALVKVQLGSGLIMLNSLLEKHRGAGTL